MTNINQPTRAKKSNGNKLTIWLIAIAAVGAVAFFNYNRIIVSYLFLLGSKSFDAGQKVFVSEEILNLNYDDMIEPRLLRPLTVKEVRDSFFLSSDKQKEALAIAEKGELKEVLQSLKYGIKLSKIKKSNSAAIGTFVGKRILPINTPDGKTVLSVFYVVKPYPEVIYNEISKFEIPQNLILADNYMYVYYSNATDKETIGLNK